MILAQLALSWCLEVTGGFRMFWMLMIYWCLLLSIDFYVYCCFLLLHDVVSNVSMFMIVHACSRGYLQWFQSNVCLSLDKFRCGCVQHQAFNIHVTHPNTHTQRSEHATNIEWQPSIMSTGNKWHNRTQNFRTLGEWDYCLLLWESNLFSWRICPRKYPFIDDFLPQGGSSYLSVGF